MKPLRPPLSLFRGDERTRGAEVECSKTFMIPERRYAARKKTQTINNQRPTNRIWILKYYTGVKHEWREKDKREVKD